MTDSPQLAILRTIKKQLAFETYGHAWEDLGSAGMVVWVREGAGTRKIRITVSDLGFQTDEEAESIIAESLERTGGSR